MVLAILKDIETTHYQPWKELNTSLIENVFQFTNVLFEILSKAFIWYLGLEFKTVTLLTSVDPPIGDFR